MNTFNNYFHITDESYSHLNILLENDTEVFIDPYQIVNNRSEDEISERIYQRNKSFFKTLNNKYVIPKKRKEGIKFLSNLREANSYHLGYASKNNGKGVGDIKAKTIFDALSNNRFTQQGISIINEAHNVLLLVEGIGQDNMSDTLGSVCRDIFAEYTLKQCKKYNIQVSEFEIKFYNSSNQKWESKKVKLPSYKRKEIILVPKSLISKSTLYPNCYNWFMSKEYISKEILTKKIQVDERSRFVTKLKNGEEKCLIKEVNNRYKKKKGKLIEFEIQYNGSLDKFQEHAKIHYLSINVNDLNRLQNKAS